MSDRAKLLCRLSSVNALYIFSELEPQRLHEKVMPDVLVNGAGNTASKIAGASEVIESGGEVFTVPLRFGLSFSKIREKFQRKELIHGYRHGRLWFHRSKYCQEFG